MIRFVVIFVVVLMCGWFGVSGEMVCGGGFRKEVGCGGGGCVMFLVFVVGGKEKCGVGEGLFM